MCGISGIYSLSNKPIKNLKPRLKLMTDLLHHRGPDQKGTYITKNNTFGLSNNRLSIVSPKEKILLPFTKNNKDYLSFNGEIYNYSEIKKNLSTNNNTKFFGKTDTEVLYEYLQKNGASYLKNLNGMWSFAYYNSLNHNLTLSRDLMGERHLFYNFSKDELIFSSEVKPILAVLKSKKINLNFQSMITSWKYNSCKPGKTLIDGINRLTAGSNLEIKNKRIKKIEHSKLNIQRWLDFFKNKPSENLVFDKFEKIFSKEVKLRIPKDVDFFSTLSGGIDSTILSIFLSRETKFNAVFGVSSNEEKKIDKYSELDLSKMTAKNLGIKHHLVYLNKKNAIKNLRYFSKNAYDGCIDAGNSNFAGLAEYIKLNKSKVAFVSDGPDELLGGYSTDIEANKIDEYLKEKNKKKFKKKIARSDIIKELNLKKNTEFEFTYKPFYSRVNHSVCPNTFLRKIIKNFNFRSIKSYGVLNLKYKNLIKKLDFSQIRALNYATQTLPEMFNLRIDKAFMKNSIETRLPFQAVNLVEFFLAMPKVYRFGKKGNCGKYFLRRYLLKRAPKTISKNISFRPKIGMGDYLWTSKTNYKKMQFEKTIQQTEIFNKFPFKKNTKNLLLKKDTHSGNKWAAYNFIKMYKI